MSEETSAEQTTSQSSATEGQQQQQQQQQQQAAAFYETFADDLKVSPQITKFKSAEDLARAYMGAEKRLGVDPALLSRLPKGMDDAEGLAAYLKPLGVPDAPEGYNIALGEGASEADLATAKGFAAAMHGVHAPPNMVKAALDWWNGQTAAAGEAAKAAQEAANATAETALKGEWGEAYQTRMSEVGRLLTELGGAELAAELDKSGLGSNVQLMKAMGKMLDKMAEPGALTGNQRPQGGGPLTPGQATAKRLELESDPIKKAALYDAGHPMHKAVVEERNKLFEAARAGQG